MGVILKSTRVVLLRDKNII